MVEGRRRVPIKKSASIKAQVKSTEVKKPSKRVFPCAAVTTTPVSKAQQFALKAEAKGWTVERVIDGDRKRAICQRADETVEVGWTNEVADGPIGVYTYSSGSSPIKNAASALRIIEGERGQFIPSPRARLAKANSAPRQPPIKLRPNKLPFDPYTSSDDDVLEAIRGRRIVWVNSLDPENPCSGHVPRAPVPRVSEKTGKLLPAAIDYTEIKLSRSEDTLGERILNFCDPNVGFRALFVGAIIRVS